MARARLLKIGFFENEDLAQLPDKARLLFAGLWLLADRAGRLEDRPLRIRGQLFPYEMCDCNALLDQLAGRGFVRRYRVGDQRLIAIPKFLTHQNPHVREPESKLPAFSQSLGSASASTVLEQGEHSSSPAVLDPVTRSGDGSDPVTVKTRPRKTRAADAPEPADFAAFYAAYPKKIKRHEALKAWRQLSPDIDLQRRMIEALEWQCLQPGWQEKGGKFIPHPASWLNGRRWEDEPFHTPDPTDAAWEEVQSRIDSRRAS